MTNTTNTATETLTRTIADTDTDAGRVELCTFKGGRTELYIEDADCGVPMFVGYIEDGATAHIPGAAYRAIAAALAVHHAAHAEFWGAYLDGASQWLHAAA